MSLKTFPFFSVVAKVLNCVWSFSRNPREFSNVQAGAEKMSVILEQNGWRDNATIDAVKVPIALARTLLASRMGVTVTDLETTGHFEPVDGHVYLCCTAHTRKRAMEMVRGRNPAKFAELFSTLPLRVFEVPLPSGEADMVRFESDLQRVYQDEMAADPSKRPLDAVERFHQITGYLKLGWSEKEVASRIFGSAEADGEKGNRRSPIQMAKRVEALGLVLPDFLAKWTAYKRGAENAITISDDLIKGDSNKQIVGLHQVLVAEREEIGVSRFGPDNCPKLKLRWSEIVNGGGKKLDKKAATRQDMEKVIEGVAGSAVKTLIGDLSGDPTIPAVLENRRKVLFNAAMQERFAGEYKELYEQFISGGGTRVDPTKVYPSVALAEALASAEKANKLLAEELEALKNAAPKTAPAKKMAAAGK